MSQKKTGDILELAVILMVLVNVNILISAMNVRMDLTEEKRFTISESSRELLGSLDDIVYIDVYLEGNFPPGFERLQKAIREKLEGFRKYAGDRLQYRFVDPSTARGSAGKNEMVQYLGRLGIQPTHLYATEEGKKTERLIFPGAVISYGGTEAGVMLLKGNKSGTSEDRLNQSVEGIEYELINTIKNLVSIERKKIGIITGHQEPDSARLYYAREILSENYDVIRINLGSGLDLKNFDVLILIKPKTAFTQQEIYHLDQYIMKGGKILFLVDMLQVDDQSIGKDGTIGYPMELNLDDLLFRYGVRINKDFILDLNSGGIPVVVGNLGNSPQFQLRQWPYYPILNQFSEHPMVRNLDAVYVRFLNSIDTVKAPGVHKTPLLFTSPYTRKVSAPVAVSLNDLKNELKPDYFQDGQMVVAWLLEGNFSSAFKNRVLPPGIHPPDFIDEGKPASVVVVSDGDLISSEINPATQTPYELGFDPFLQARFANGEFLLNVISYLTDSDGIILTRAKKISIRPLDKIKVEKNKPGIQAANLLLPVLVVLIFGSIRFFYRRRKFSRST